jgi:Do/DeqQ family serine protease
MRTLLLALFFAAPVLAEPLPVPRQAPLDTGQMRLSFAPVVKRAAPAVVNVYSKRLVRQQVDPFWGIFGGFARSHVEQSLGSGTIVRSDGVILTNHHNIEGAQDIVVVTADHREWPAKVLLDDPRIDLAVLKIEVRDERLPTLALDDRSDLQVGDLVLAIGNPFGVGQTVTNGIISALERSDVGAGNGAAYIQTDAAINPGNSGGPLVDMAGDQIGVNTFIVSQSGGSAGVGFAIPARLAKQAIEAALGGASVVARPWLGVKTQALTAELARGMGLTSNKGVVVTDVWPDSPAARAGIRNGDIILSAAGAAVFDDPALAYQYNSRRPGETLPLVVAHGGAEPRSVDVRLELPPATPAPDRRTLSGANPFAGAVVENLSPAGAIAQGFDPFTVRGVVVVQVGEGYAQNIGLQRGDVIRAVNSRPIASTRDLSDVIAVGGHAWRLTIVRNGQEITADFRG